jgi:hypothetical protein
MSPEQWQKINAVFKDVQTRTPAEREIFLDEVCDGDEEMRCEIESLLSSYKNAESFLEMMLVEKWKVKFQQRIFDRQADIISIIMKSSNKSALAEWAKFI